MFSPYHSEERKGIFGKTVFVLEEVICYIGVCV